MRDTKNNRSRWCCTETCHTSDTSRFARSTLARCLSRWLNLYRSRLITRKLLTSDCSHCRTRGRRWMSTWTRSSKRNKTSTRSTRSRLITVGKHSSRGSCRSTSMTFLRRYRRGSRQWRNRSARRGSTGISCCMTGTLTMNKINRN